MCHIRITSGNSPFVAGSSSSSWSLAHTTSKGHQNQCLFGEPTHSRGMQAGRQTVIEWRHIQHGRPLWEWLWNKRQHWPPATRRKEEWRVDSHTISSYGAFMSPSMVIVHYYYCLYIRIPFPSGRAHSFRQSFGRVCWGHWSDGSSRFGTDMYCRVLYSVLIFLLLVLI